MIIYRKKVPNSQRLTIATIKNLGDNPKIAILKPSNLTPPVSVLKEAECQYTIVFHKSTVGETVDFSLTAANFSLWGMIKDMFFAIFALFTLTFWKGLLPGGTFWSTFSFKRFFVRTVVFSLIVFVGLLGMELSGFHHHKKFLRWLNTLEMVESTSGAIKGAIGLDGDDGFFKSEEALNYYSRTGHKLGDDYILTDVIENGDEKYQMLIRKQFHSGFDLDSAENICWGEIEGDIPAMGDYYNFMNNDAVKSNLDLAFAEWTDTSYGLMSDDYELFIVRENSKTWQSRVEIINSLSGSALEEFAKNYDVPRADLDGDDYRDAIVAAVNREVRLPAETNVIYRDGVPSFYLDADREANFRCIRKLPIS